MKGYFLLRLLIGLSCIFTLSCTTTTPPQPLAENNPSRKRKSTTKFLDLKASFAAEHAIGTVVLFYPDSNLTTIHNPKRADSTFCPASTFKIYNSLVAIETGLVKNIDSMFVWDGETRSLPIWNQNHSLRSGIRNSVVWLYQRLARSIGRTGYKKQFKHAPFGNSIIGQEIDMFWLDGSLRISAMQQVKWLDALRKNQLPFTHKTQESVRSILPQLFMSADKNSQVKIFGKTGWGQPIDEPDIGWIVGWAEHPNGDVIYALNCRDDGSNQLDMRTARLNILRDVLDQQLSPTQID